jgi:hypothetical protein
MTMNRLRPSPIPASYTFRPTFAILFDTLSGDGFQPMPSSSAKLISTLLLLLGSAVAQTQPFAFSEVSPYTWQGKNVASKEILAYVIEFESPHVMIVAHDYYFKPEAIAPGAIEVFDQVKASELGHVLWVQFVDGTEWGDHRIGLSDLLQHRQPTLRWVTEMVSAYSHGGEKKFSAYLESNKEVDGFVKHVWIMQQQTGTDGVLGHLKIRLASAAKHDKMLEAGR